jgi:hypothetical protein
MATSLYMGVRAFVFIEISAGWVCEHDLRSQGIESLSAYLSNYFKS